MMRPRWGGRPGRKRVIRVGVSRMIDDITDVYLFMLEHPEHAGVFNAGFENISILDIAERVRRKVQAEVVVTESNDPRSYRVNSDKLLATGFRPKKSVDDAIDDVIARHRSGELEDSEQCYNLKWMQRTVLT